MNRPTRESRAGQAYLDLQNLARRNRRPTDELLALYTLEGFLDRLSHSADADRFVLKGGTLLAAYDLRRPTRDVDLQAIASPMTPIWSSTVFRRLLEARSMTDWSSR
ncbi:nucleotidyl transferase AbiEii/AbiGii toxin family protein [Kribbella qitaiheensis]|uniref:nucleotidyl transferase AbiEii/AbiGii toxin family protein n=1 Tax=Kribbella qitaiheensis TaxID=1544730 RepID=UPI001627D9C8|nr:nucleotidyl transferase AbiEii/AbiGii toxin family protein [Kribbella qitaiheensis]